MSKREWWIDSFQEDEESNVVDAFLENPEQGPLPWRASLIHAIDFASYQAVVEKNRKLREALEASRNMALEEAAEIVQQARSGEIDSDFRTIIYLIESLKGTKE